MRPPEPTLAFIVDNDEPGTDLVGWIHNNRTSVQERLVRHGAVLLRGFDVDGVDGFDAAVRALSGVPLSYSERSSPRSTIKGQVYTSTDYPSSEEIFLHNENSYQASWPRTLFFHCLQPPTTEGATPLADTRLLCREVDPAVRDEFARRKWMVVRNFRAAFGSAWEHVFGTGDRAEVERYCASRGIAYDWVDGGLRTKAVREAVHKHPDSGEPVWFNHATFFHVTTLPAELRDALCASFPEDGLPTNTYYGDGGRIPDDVLEHLRACYRAGSTRFDWRFGDVLVVDNMAVAHGREPYTGPRKIAVAMAEPYPHTDSC